MLIWMLLEVKSFFNIFTFRETVRSMHPPGESIIAFKASITKEDEAFTGSVNQYDEVSIWATERCIPLVREITFQVRTLFL